MLFCIRSLVCFGLTGLSMACVCVFIRNHDLQMKQLSSGKHHYVVGEDYSKSTDLLFTRLLNAICSFSPLFNYSGNEKTNVHSTHAQLNAADNKGSEKSLKQLLNVLTARKFLDAIQSLISFN